MVHINIVWRFIKQAETVGIISSVSSCAQEKDVQADKYQGGLVVCTRQKHQNLYIFQIAMESDKMITRVTISGVCPVGSEKLEGEGAKWIIWYALNHTIYRDDYRLCISEQLVSNTNKQCLSRSQEFFLL